MAEKDFRTPLAGRLWPSGKAGARIVGHLAFHCSGYEPGPCPADLPAAALPHSRGCRAGRDAAAKSRNSISLRHSTEATASVACCAYFRRRLEGNRKAERQCLLHKSAHVFFVLPCCSLQLRLPRKEGVNKSLIFVPFRERGVTG